ncbi:hypothetical protein PLICRDRAFT_693203 [Plicaturopsis crispa FD-325 SS-3]|nr:hypothetical protein PLICRDRAFT_693203 [Plicaturopsis crispa FD-325 SS-3]
MADASVYYTHPVAAATQQHVAALLSSVDEGGGPYVHVPYNPAHGGLSPLQLFQALQYSFTDTGFVIIADQRTEQEIDTAHPSVTVAAAWEITLGYEWDLYRGDRDLDALPEAERLAFLRELAEARAQADGDPWVWEPDAEQNGLDGRIWQVKSVRADIAGAENICAVYRVKDINDMHGYYKSLADQNGGVVHGSQL